MFSNRALNNGPPYPGLPWLLLKVLNFSKSPPTVRGLRYILFNLFCG